MQSGRGLAKAFETTPSLPSGQTITRPSNRADY